MKLTGMAGVVCVAIVTACASTSLTTVPKPAGNPGIPPSPAKPPATTPVPSAPTPRSGSWAFTYAPGTYTYVITTNAVIAPMTDTIQKRQVPQLSQSATITASGTGDIQVMSPIAGPTGSCDVIAATIVRAQTLLPKIPNHLTAGDHWRDSTITTGCRGSIPARSQTMSDYVVLGDTTLGITTALQIHRTDSLRVSGEGSDGQHRIILDATGSGVADLYLNTASGRLVSSHNAQTSYINVTTSGRRTQFVQHVNESAVIAGMQ
jgi:hypothetical protein